MSATASPPRPLAPSSTPTVQGLTNRDPIMGRDKKAVAGPSLVALRTSFGTSSLDASTSTLFGSSTGRKRGRAQVSSSPEPSSSREPASSPPPPPKKGSADDPDYASLYPVCGPGFYNSWPKQAPEGKRPKGEKRLRRFVSGINPAPMGAKKKKVEFNLSSLAGFAPTPLSPSLTSTTAPSPSDSTSCHARAEAASTFGFAPRRS